MYVEGVVCDLGACACVHRSGVLCWVGCIRTQGGLYMCTCLRVSKYPPTPPQSVMC